jgi:hypothetical protein
VEEVPEISPLTAGGGAQIELRLPQQSETTPAEVTVGGGSSSQRAHMVEW